MPTYWDAFLAEDDVKTSLPDMSLRQILERYHFWHIHQMTQPSENQTKQTTGTSEDCFPPSVYKNPQW